MPEEIKDLQFTKEERELGTKLLDKYKRESYILDNAYYQQHAVLLTVREVDGDEAYMELKKPIWADYKNKDKKLYEEFMDDVESLGFKLRAI